jgi:hypothetical protein
MLMDGILVDDIYINQVGYVQTYTVPPLPLVGPPTIVGAKSHISPFVVDTKQVADWAETTRAVADLILKKSGFYDFGD